MTDTPQKTATASNTRPANLCEKHYNELKASGISDSIIEKNFRTIEDSREVDRLLNRNNNRRWKHSDQLVPCWSVTGLDPRGWERIENGVQIKPDTPPVDENGKVQKYVGASKQDAAPLFLDSDEPDYWHRVLRDLSIPLFITEGAKKAACGLSHDYATISIPGVSTCRKLGRLHPDLKIFSKLGRTEYLVFDNDAMTKKPVQKALLGLGLELRALGVKVMVVELPPGDAKGMDDFISKNGKEEFDKLVDSALTIEEYKQKLEKLWEKDVDEETVQKDKQEEALTQDRKNKFLHTARKNTINNVYGEELRWNELTLKTEINGESVNADLLVDKVAEDCGIKFSERDTRLIVYSLAKQNAFHPVKDYLDEVSSLHSNTEIIEKIASNLLKTNNPLYDTMFKKWLIGAVARVMQPGCKMDDVLILFGKQSALKSTVFSVLGGDWFSDDCEGTGNDKDSLMQLHNSWINELPEIDRFLGKRDASDLKKALSVKIDKFRVPYGREVEPFPRQFVMCGSTNKDEFLTDPTGNRRYWVIPIGTEKIDIRWLEEHRDEIWAAAVHLYNQGQTWWLDDSEKAKHAELMKPFEMSDTWEDYILPYLAERKEVTVSDILHNCLQIGPALQKKPEQMRVAEILKRFGWVKENRGIRVWVRPIVEQGGEEVANEVAKSETITSEEFQKNLATSPPFSEKNIFDEQNNNNNSNQNINVESSEKGGEVAKEKNATRETGSQSKSQGFATPAATSLATSENLEKGDRVEYVGANPASRAQYQGELKVHSMDYGMVCLQMADGRISTWLHFEEIRKVS